MRLTVDLVSDVVCPWCAIGDAYLQQAREQLADEMTINVVWHPFVLNPDVPPEGRDMVSHLAAKYGKSAEEVRESQQQIIETAHRAGLNFERAAERRSWNTFDTHRVLAYAKENDCYEPFKRALFEAYFGRAENPTDPAVLGRIGRTLGLDDDAIQAVLASDDYAETVRADIEGFQKAGVTAVPGFVVDKRYLISGAQPPDALVDAFRRIAAESQPAEA